MTTKRGRRPAKREFEILDGDRAIHLTSRNGVWYETWWDAETQTTRRLSLDTTDFGEAVQALKAKYGTPLRTTMLISLNTLRAVWRASVLWGCHHCQHEAWYKGSVTECICHHCGWSMHPRAR